MVDAAGPGVENVKGMDDFAVEVECCVFGRCPDDQIDHQLVGAHTERPACLLERHLPDLHFV